MPEVVKIEIDLDKMTIGDLETLDKAGAGKLGPAALVEFLDRLVIGGARQLPFTQLSAVVKAVGEAIQARVQGEVSGPVS